MRPAGWHHSEETKQKLADRRRGVRLSAEHRAKIGAAGVGRVQSEETKEKRRASCRLAALARGSRVGESNAHWKGGIRQDAVGYRTVYAPEADRKWSGRYVPEHRLVAESVYGPLHPKAVIHHIDGDRANNAKNNLLICTNGCHVALHARMRALAPGA